MPTMLRASTVLGAPPAMGTRSSTKLPCRPARESTASEAVSHHDTDSSAESGLAILGLGVAPPTPSWGGMIVEGYRYALTAPYLIAAPLALFAITMLAFTWLGDGLRDAFDANEEDAA